MTYVCSHALYGSEEEVVADPILADQALERLMCKE
jgi:hypothetical protein